MSAIDEIFKKENGWYEEQKSLGKKWSYYSSLLKTPSLKERTLRKLPQMVETQSVEDSSVELIDIQFADAKNRISRSKSEINLRYRGQK